MHQIKPNHPRLCSTNHPLKMSLFGRTAVRSPLAGRAWFLSPPRTRPRLRPSGFAKYAAAKTKQLAKKRSEVLKEKKKEARERELLSRKQRQLKDKQVRPRALRRLVVSSGGSERTGFRVGGIGWGGKGVFFCAPHVGRASTACRLSC